MVRLESSSAKVIAAAGASASRARGSGQVSTPARTRSTPYAMSSPPKPIASVARNVHIPVAPTPPVPWTVSGPLSRSAMLAIWLTELSIPWESTYLIA